MFPAYSSEPTKAWAAEPRSSVFPSGGYMFKWLRRHRGGEDCWEHNDHCLSAGFPPFSGLEREAQDAGRSAMPSRLLESLRDEEKSVTTAMGLSRCAAHLPCSWFNTADGSCRYWEFRPLVCRPESDA